MAYPITNKIIKEPEDSPVSSDVAPAKKESWIKGLVTLILVLVILGGGIYLIASYTGVGGGFFSSAGQLQSDWQAVFLANGQVYFGKVAKMDKDVIVLRNIYYLQIVNQPLQTTQTGETAAATEAKPELKLFKLGNEIHGPKDEMIINRAQVVLIEDLKNDSRVVQAINDFISKGGK